MYIDSSYLDIALKFQYYGLESIIEIGLIASNCKSKSNTLTTQKYYQGNTCNISIFILSTYV